MKRRYWCGDHVVKIVVDDFHKTAI